MAFQLLTITTQDRPVLRPDGEPAPAEEQLVVGQTFKHWADTTNARRWFLQAWAWLNDASYKAECDAPPNFTDYAINAEQTRKQLDFVGRVCWALMQGYNHLNVPAMNDPAARRAYHKWVSGGPAGSTLSAQMQNWFRPEANFGGGSFDTGELGRWFLPNRAYPIFGGPAPAAGGNIGKLARNAFDRLYDAGPGRAPAAEYPSAFVVNVGITLESDNRGENKPGNPVDYQLYVRNRAFSDREYSTPEITDRLLGTRGVGYLLPEGVRLPNPYTSGYQFWDWRAVFFDVDPWAGPAGDGPKPLVAPMRAYLDYLNELVEAALSRSPEQIIQDTRAFVAWMNAMQIQVGYSRNANAFLSGVMGVDATSRLQQLAGDPNLALASNLVGTFGAGIGGVVAAANPIAGGIVALASGAVSGILRLINTQITGDVRGVGVDDFGRWKPRLVRSVLSGDISNADYGMPQINETYLQPAPMDFKKAQTLELAQRGRAKPASTFRILQPFDTYSWGIYQPELPEEEGGSGWWLLAGAAVIGVGLAVRQGRKRRR